MFNKQFPFGDKWLENVTRSELFTAAQDCMAAAQRFRLRAEVLATAADRLDEIHQKIGDAPTLGEAGLQLTLPEIEALRNASDLLDESDLNASRDAAWGSLEDEQ
ncbi:MAG: hypothetical protein ACF8MJ_06140 [Phycisphaerales bacterium JB050]